MMLDYEKGPNCKHISMNFHEDNVVSYCIILLQSHVLINIYMLIVRLKRMSSCEDRFVKCLFFATMDQIIF